MPLDQVEVLLQNERATKEVAALTATITAAGRECPARPALTGDMIQDGELLNAHVVKLRVLAKLATPPAPSAKATEKRTITQLSAAVREGTMTIEEALAARPRHEPSRFTKMDKGS